MVKPQQTSNPQKIRRIWYEHIGNAQLAEPQRSGPIGTLCFKQLWTEKVNSTQPVASLHRAHIAVSIFVYVCFMASGNKRLHRWVLEIDCAWRFGHSFQLRWWAVTHDNFTDYSLLSFMLTPRLVQRLVSWCFLTFQCQMLAMLSDIVVPILFRRLVEAIAKCQPWVLFRQSMQLGLTQKDRHRSAAKQWCPAWTNTCGTF